MQRSQILQHTEDISAKKHICAVDLFCGAGGLTYGLINAGIDVRLGIDIDPACEYPYKVNNKTEFLLKSIDNVAAQDIAHHFTNNSIKLLAGCAPCQTFSKYNQKAKDSDKRWWLLRQFSRLVKEIQPELVTMENVPPLIEQNVFTEFYNTLENNGYKISYSIVQCSDYGIPQLRKRLVLLASRLGDISLLLPEEFGHSLRTVKDAIWFLPPIAAGTKDPLDPLHQCSALSNINLQRIRASRPGGTWHDWPNELVTSCHKKSSGRGYSSVYGRMSWNQPAPTITTQFFGFGNGRFGHPEQDRAISLREGAILQGFPQWYEFVPPGKPICRKVIGRLIGNAVPVILGTVIGRSLVSHVAHVTQ